MIIKIPIELTISRLDVLLESCQIALKTKNIFSNGRSSSRDDTLLVQQWIMLSDKLAKKRMSVQLNPPKKQTFKLKLKYAEAYYLIHALRIAFVRQTGYSETINMNIQMEIEKKL